MTPHGDGTVSDRCEFATEKVRGGSGQNFSNSCRCGAGLNFFRNNRVATLVLVLFD